MLNAAVDFFNHLNILYGTITEFVRRLPLAPPVLTRSAPSARYARSAPPNVPD